MNRVKELFNKYREIIVYVIFGVLTTIVNFATFWICSKALGNDGYIYLLNNAIAWIVSVIFAYITNKIFVFESRSFSPKVLFKECTQFVIARLLSFGIEELGMYIFVDLLHFEKYTIEVFEHIIDGQMISKIILAVVVVILNYFFSKFIIFAKKKNKTED